jgi:chromosome partitioning protein
MLTQIDVPVPYSKGAWLRSVGLTPAELAGTVFTVASYKGGVGKTLLAYELAFLLDGILVDLDWDKGGATKKWGYDPDLRVNAPLVDLVEKDRIPKPLSGKLWRPDLVPCTPDLKYVVPPAEKFTEILVQLAKELGQRYQQAVVFDTHPGGGPEAFAPIATSNVVLGVVELGQQEMSAGEQLVDELKAYPLLLVPNRVTGTAQEDRYLDWLDRLTETAGVPVAPPIVDMRHWVKVRRSRMAVTANKPTARFAKLRKDLEAVAGAAVSYVRAAA